CWFRDTASSVLYSLSLHDALPISSCPCPSFFCLQVGIACDVAQRVGGYRFCGAIVQRIVRVLGERIVDQRVAQVDHSLPVGVFRSEEHTSELQSRENLVCRLLLEK